MRDDRRFEAVHQLSIKMERHSILVSVKRIANNHKDVNNWFNVVYNTEYSNGSLSVS